MDNDEIRISDLLYTVFKHRKTILVLGLLGYRSQHRMFLRICR